MTAAKDDRIRMTPALRAALVKLRDASVTWRTAIDATTNYNTRSKEGKAQQQRCFDAADARRDAIDDLLAIIDPASTFEE